jgi:hypothetical protein
MSTVDVVVEAVDTVETTEVVAVVVVVTEETDVQVAETVMDALVADVTAVMVDKVAEAKPYSPFIQIQELYFCSW